MKRICSGCGKDLGEKYPDQPGITHGICIDCIEDVLAEEDGQHSITQGGGGVCPSFIRPQPVFLDPGLLQEETAPARRNR